MPIGLSLSRRWTAGHNGLFQRLRSSVCVWACGVALAFGSPASASDEFDQRVMDAILSNPEIIVLALGLLKEQEEAETRAQHLAEVQTVLPELFGAGLEAGGPILAEFFDYRCGYCSEAATDVAELETLYPNAVVYVELPILGAESVAISRFALAVDALHGPDTYRSFHHAMMAAEPRLRTEAGAHRIASALGLDPDAISARAEASDIDTKLRQNREIASRLGIQGTPAFVGRGGVHPGAVNIDTLKSIATEEVPS